MSMITGQGAALQIGQESKWGTAVAPTAAINFTSEGFKPVLDYTEEDSLVGGATTSGMDLQKKSVSWSMGVLARPGNIGLLFGLAFGTEASPVKQTNKSSYEHKFTMLQPSASATLPKFTGIVNRHIAKKAYTGCKVDSLQISAKAGDYMRLTLSGSGKDEIDGSSYYDSSKTVSDTKAFRFKGGTCTLDSTTFGAVQGVTFGLNNALDGGEQTLGSGDYGTEPEPQKRTVKVTLEAIYDDTGETIRESNYKTGTALAAVLNFESPTLADSTNNVKSAVQLNMPHLVITSADPVINDAGKIKLTIEGTAIESGTDEAVTAYLIDSSSSKYLA